MGVATAYRLCAAVLEFLARRIARAVCHCHNPDSGMGSAGMFEALPSRERLNTALILSASRACASSSERSCGVTQLSWPLLRTCFSGSRDCERMDHSGRGIGASRSWTTTESVPRSPAFEQPCSCVASRRPTRDWPPSRSLLFRL